MKAYDPRVTSTVALTALTVWIGGLLTLGAIVAPIVFRAVPFDLAADTMAVVFARYDKVAMGAAAAVILSEALRAVGHVDRSRSGVARLVCSLLIGGMAVVEGFWVTPTIAALHAQGVVRGVGEAGAALASAHTMAEQLGKAQALLAIALIALHVATVAPKGSERAR